MPGGIVVADDVFNQQWPDVASARSTTSAATAGWCRSIGYNKTLFTQPEYAARYRDALAAGFAKSRLTAAFPEKSFAGDQVVILVAVAQDAAHSPDQPPGPQGAKLVY